MRNHYPNTYRIALQVLGKQKELISYIQYCKNKRDGSFEDYSIFVHGFLVPLFESMQLNGKLNSGRKTIMIEGKKWNYQGELDSYGEPFGYGEASCGEFNYRGTFLNGVFDGFGVLVLECVYK